MEYNKKLSIRDSIRKNKVHKKPRNFRSSEFNNTESRRCSYPNNPNSLQEKNIKRHSGVSSSLSENPDHDADFVPLATAFERYPDSNGQVLFSREKEIFNGTADIQSKSKHEDVQKQCSLPTGYMNDVLAEDCNADSINEISGKDKNCRHKQTI